MILIPLSKVLFFKILNLVAATLAGVLSHMPCEFFGLQSRQVGRIIDRLSDSFTGQIAAFQLKHH